MMAEGLNELYRPVRLFHVKIEPFFFQAMYDVVVEQVDPPPCDYRAIVYLLIIFPDVIDGLSHSGSSPVYCSLSPEEAFCSAARSCCCKASSKLYKTAA